MPDLTFGDWMNRHRLAFPASDGAKWLTFEVLVEILERNKALYSAERPYLVVSKQPHLSNVENNKKTASPALVRSLGLAFNLDDAEIERGLVLAAGVSPAIESQKGNIGVARGVRGVKNDLFPLSLEVVDIPILARATAGIPVFAPENIEGNTSVRRDQIPTGSERITFGLYIQDNSMRGDGLRKGDLVIAMQAERAENGKQVVARLRDGRVVVRWFCRPAGGAPYIESEPKEGERVVTETDGWQIIGIVLFSEQPR